jgi:hypothetical protein
MTTRVSISGRGDGGHHRWFLHPGGRLSAARLGTSVDLKTHTGYVVLRPSRHPATGQPYRWAEPTLDPAALPGRLAAAAVADIAADAGRPPPPPSSISSGWGGRRDLQPDQRWTQVLGPHGWICPDPDPDADGARWRHPGATNSKSATIRHGLLFVYSQATPFTPTEAGAPAATAASAPTPSWTTAGTCAPPPEPSGTQPGDRSPGPTDPHHPGSGRRPGCWPSCAPPSPATWSFPAPRPPTP